MSQDDCNISCDFNGNSVDKDDEETTQEDQESEEQYDEESSEDFCADMTCNGNGQKKNGSKKTDTDECLKQISQTLQDCYQQCLAKVGQNKK